jgi:hypothetical protein
VARTRAGREDAGGRRSGVSSLGVQRGALAALLLAGLAVGASARAAPPPVPLLQGDLLVTDSANQQVLRVDRVTGAVSIFSPRSGQTNLLQDPVGIAIDPDGYIYVADKGAAELILIDPQTGEQSVACTIVIFPQYACNPLAIGSAPVGVALAPDTDATTSTLYVSSDDGIYTLTRLVNGSVTASLLISAGAHAPLLALADDDPDQKLYVIDGASTLVDVDLGNPTGFTTDVTPSGFGDRIGGVAASGVNAILYAYQDQSVPDPIDCAGGGSDLHELVNGTDVAAGLTFRCPGALASRTGLVLNPPIYVADTDLPDGGSPTIDLVTAPPPAVSVFTDLSTTGPLAPFPAGIAIAPVDFVPEPGAGASAGAVLLALVLARRPRGRVRPGAIGSRAPAPL